jgi:hypothetical protein
MEQRILQREGKVAARASLATESLEGRLTSLREPEVDLEIEAELLALKAAAEQLKLGAGSSNAGE